MRTPIEEAYVFRQLSLIDMKRAQRSLEYVADTTDEHLREALFRDAVVSYAKPFSDNRGIHVKKGLRLKEKGIPAELKATHAEIIRIRNELFAHMDLPRQAPRMDEYKVGGKRATSFTVAGYGKVYTEHLIQPLKQLTKAVHNQLLREMMEIKQKHF